MRYSRGAHETVCRIISRETLLWEKPSGSVTGQEIATSGGRQYGGNCHCGSAKHAGQAEGQMVTVVNMRFVKPIDEEMLVRRTGRAAQVEVVTIGRPGVFSGGFRR